MITWLSDWFRRQPNVVTDARLMEIADSLAEEHDSIGIGAFSSVNDSPTMGRLGEFLIIDQDELRFKARRDTGLQYRLLEPHLSTPNLTDFEGNPAIGPEYALQFVKDPNHKILPIIQATEHRESQ